MDSRKAYDSYSQPMLTYEVHLGSWRFNAEGEPLTYRELADQLVQYVKDMHYTHIEIMPLCEYPLMVPGGIRQLDTILLRAGMAGRKILCISSMRAIATALVSYSIGCRDIIAAMPTGYAFLTVNHAMSRVILYWRKTRNGTR